MNEAWIMVEENPLPDGNPKGALALMACYAIFVTASWLFIYFVLFIPRG